MKRFVPHGLLVAITVGLLVSDNRSVAAESPHPSGGPPNIIFFMADQQRWDCLGVLNPQIKTPNLDRLARQGILFRQAVCQGPMCVPSRYFDDARLVPFPTGRVLQQ